MPKLVPSLLIARLLLDRARQPKFTKKFTKSSHGIGSCIAGRPCAVPTILDIRVKIASVPRPEAGFRMLVDQAPRVEACAEQMLERCRPGLTWFQHAYRRLATVAVALLTLWMLVHVVFGANGMVVYRQKRAEFQDLRKEVDDLQRQNDQYSAQIKALQSDPNTIEKEAREQLHYARPGEVIYVEPPPPSGHKPMLDSARK